jgi:superfamily II DNA or RNA helicase
MTTELTLDTTHLLTVVGGAVFMAARGHVQRGEVALLPADSGRSHLAGSVVGTGHRVLVDVERDERGRVAWFRQYCDCPDPSCAHGVAVLLRSMAGEPAAARPSAGWEQALGPLLAAPVPAQLELGLQFEVAAGAGLRPAVRLRPVIRNERGRWVRQGVSWAAVHRRSWEVQSASPEQLRLLAEVLMMDGGGTAVRAWDRRAHLDLDEISSRRLWDLLGELQDSGVPLLQAGASPVRVHRDPVRFASDLTTLGDDLALTAVLVSAEHGELPAGGTVLIGDPAHGVAWWDPAARGVRRTLDLAPLAEPLGDLGARLLTGGPVTVPRGDRNRFLTDYYPTLRRRLAVRADPSIEVPPDHPPVLRLIVSWGEGHRVRVEGEWRYGGRLLGLQDDAAAWRDEEAERRILAGLGPDLPADRLGQEVVLTGVTAARFVAETVPDLLTRDDVEVVLDVHDDAPDYRESSDVPEVLVTGAAEPGDRDWFDLAVSVHVGGEEVPFATLFLALAQGEPYLLLPSGTYFRLDHDALRRLAELIVEARALQDADRDPNRLRLSRFQAGLWEELERIGVVEGQAAVWQQSVRALREAPEAPPPPVPAGLRADLRPYQATGFAWLAALHRYRLGGVLADDMGLGKTLQALALVQHVREDDAGGAPFLVVAPTSVVANWATEAARFTPDLRVAMVTATRARRRTPLADAVAGADLVVTSYTLLRLEVDDYAALPWAGLVLDEAQMVKNHQARTYAAARIVPAPFKLAITGTPMENNLMELWSLLSITAPGLLSDPGRFTDFYRTPIEKERDVDRLDRLRRRIRPLVLRRRKDEVLKELPDKQEQVLAIELNPKHRKAYQALLHRERQKVLGLLADLQGNRFEILRSLTMLRQASLDMRLVDPEAYADIAPTKLDELVNLVGELATENHRTLVFSQFTRFLGSARDRLETAGLGCSYLDGSTTDRAATIEAFKQGADPAFLISLKAGGFGLNLTEADYCILLDPWWNPAVEAQAVDRIHRIGQTRKVMVYRLVAQGTIEEKVMALKAEKSALFSSVVDGGDFHGGALTAADIRGLLG